MKRILVLSVLAGLLVGCATADKLMATARAGAETVPAIVDDARTLGERAKSLKDKAKGLWDRVSSIWDKGTNAPVVVPTVKKG